MKVITYQFSNKPHLSRDEQINLARHHTTAIHAVREAANRAINELRNHIPKIEWEDDIAAGLHTLLDNIAHIPGDIDGAMHDSGIGNLFTDDELDTIEQERADELAFQRDLSAGHYANL